MPSARDDGNRRRSRPCSPARPSGRTGRPLPGPSATACGAERLRAAQDGADVSRVGDAVEVDDQRAGERPAPTAPRRPRASGCPDASSETPSQQLRLHLGAGQTAPGGGETLDRRPAGGVGRGEQILALRDEPARPVALTPALAELADLLELLVVGAGDRHRCRGVSCSETKRAPSAIGAAPDMSGAGGCRRSLSRPPAPRGRGRQSVGRCRRRARRCRPGPCGPARHRRAASRA